MRKIAIALLTTTMLGTPAAFAASNANQPPRGQQTQQPQGQQMQHNQKQSGQNSENQNQQNQQNGQQSAENNKSMQPQNLSRGEVRQVQQALDKDGFKTGPTDGRWGRETENALKQFQQSKQIQATGQLDQQTVADLGLDASKFQQPENQQK